MPNIKIDNTTYDKSKLSAEAKKQLNTIHYVDAELRRLNAQQSILQTARLVYATALRQTLAAPDNVAAKLG